MANPHLQMEYIINRPYLGRRFTEEQTAALRAFVKALEYDRDFDTVAGAALGIAALINSRRRNIGAMATIDHARVVASGVIREWDR